MRCERLRSPLFPCSSEFVAELLVLTGSARVIDGSPLVLLFFRWWDPVAEISRALEELSGGPDGGCFPASSSISADSLSFSGRLWSPNTSSRDRFLVGNIA